MAQAIILVTSPPGGVLTPDFQGQKAIDTANDKIYISYGLTDADWQEVGAGGGSGMYPGNVVDLGVIDDLAPATINLDVSNFFKCQINGENTVLDFISPTDTTKVNYAMIHLGYSNFWTSPTVKTDGTAQAVIGSGNSGNQYVEAIYSDGSWRIEWKDFP